MHLSRRIISAEDIGSFEPFDLGALAAHEHGASAASRSGHPGLGGGNDPQADLEAMLEQSYREGLLAGREQALRERDEQDRAFGATLQQRVSGLLLSLDQEFNDFQTRHADRVTELALMIAAQILRRSIEVDRGAILPVVREALDHLYDEAAPAVLRLNPIDTTIVLEQLDALLKRRRIDVVADETIEAGGCRLVSNDAEVDASLRTRWRKLLAAMGRPAPSIADESAMFETAMADRPMAGTADVVDNEADEGITAR